MSGYTIYLLIPENGVKVENGLLLLRREFASLDVWPQVVCPSQSATLAASIEAYKERSTNTIPTWIGEPKIRINTS